MSEPTKAGRAGDSQPMPTVGTQNELDSVQFKVKLDISERMEVGFERYGTYLFPNNGRDALTDAYEEALDLCMYLKQAIIERGSGGPSGAGSGGQTA